MENKTAEGILRELPSIVISGRVKGVFIKFDGVIPAMKEYAKQESIGFAEWIDKASEYREVGRGIYRDVAGKTYTITELYTQYLTDKNK